MTKPSVTPTLRELAEEEQVEKKMGAHGILQTKRNGCCKGVQLTT